MTLPFNYKVQLLNTRVHSPHAVIILEEPGTYEAL